MASYNYTIAVDLEAILQAAYPSEDIAVSFVPEFDKTAGSARLTRVVPYTDITVDGDGSRSSDVHTIVIAVGIWKPLEDIAVATVAAQLEYAEGVLSQTRRLVDTIGGVQWGWQQSGFDPIYDPEMLRDDFEFMSWIGVQFQGMTP